MMTCIEVCLVAFLIIATSVVYYAIITVLCGGEW